MRKTLTVVLIFFILYGCGDKPKYEFQPETFETEVKISKKGSEPIDSSAIIKLPIDPLVISPEWVDNLLFEIGLHHEVKYNQSSILTKIELRSVEIANLNDTQKYNYIDNRETPSEFWNSDSNEWGIYRVRQTYNLPDDKGVILFLYIYEHREGKSQLMALFEKKNDALIFKTFLPKVYQGFGLNLIDTILSVKNSYLITGTFSGDDDGSKDRNIWFDKYTQPDSVTEIYSKKFAFYIEENDKKFERLIDTAKGISIITIYERKVLEFGHGETKFGEWNTVEADTLKYAKYFP